MTRAAHIHRTTRLARRGRGRAPSILGAVVVTASCLCALLVGGEEARAEHAPGHAAFDAVGAHDFVVPEDVCQVTVDAYGAQGGDGDNQDGPPGPGGKGGRATATIPVTAGETLRVTVGGQGAVVTGGFNGGGDGGSPGNTQQSGGGGGGASDVRREPFSLNQRLVVAGGGGGGGGDDELPPGGHGGGLTGGDGSGGGPTPTPGGKGGTQAAGGAAPTGFDPTATDGTLGSGGRGGTGAIKPDDSGGGGGGGLFGGGGGAGENDDVPTDNGGGGGGGSGFGPAGTVFETGVRTGNGYVELAYTPGTGCDEIDWTMPDRFGSDTDNDGKIDYFPPSPGHTLVIEPDGWRVDITHGDPAACDATLSRTWWIDGIEIASSDPNVIAYDPVSCEFSYTFPSEDVYDVEVFVTDPGGDLVGYGRRDVIVQDWLIVSIGDSVASGEGVPDLPGRSQVEWQSHRCHRSANAGTAVAARRLERDDERTSVTFVHLACSGAEIFQGLLRAYNGIEYRTGERRPPAQIDDMARLVGSREIDAVLISVGANDVEFSEIVKDCMKFSDCHLGRGARRFAGNVAELPSRFQRLDNEMKARLPRLSPNRVYITEYFDPTRFDDGTICGSRLAGGTYSDELLHDHPAALLGFGVSPAEAGWASNIMLPRLNTVIANAASSNRWQYVGGIRSAFLTHGYCAAQRWIVTYTESKATQGDENGTLHPNLRGQILGYAGPIESALRVDFYRGGGARVPLPRTP